MLKFILFFFPLFAFSYPASDHFNGKEFFNPQGDDLKSFWQVIKWKMTSTPEEWPEHLPNKHYPFRTLAPYEKVSATFINHATFLLQYQSITVLTDPVFSMRVSPVTFAGPTRVRNPGIPFELLPKIDVVVISHNHYDHLDIETIKKLDQKFHPLFLVPLGDEKLLHKENIKNVRALDWWEEFRVKDVRFVFTPSQHWSARSLWDKNQCLWGSFMIDNGSEKTFFAGDTGFGSHFKEIKKRLGSPHLSLIPIGAYKPRWFMKFYHLNPEEAVLAHLALGSKKSIGMHFGTFQLTDEGIDEPLRDLKIALEKYKIMNDEFIIIDEGQTFSF
jgi:L-ascorbate metabolism protein UlaG (beta-lactamase superfamily)